jgi:hypothetical protein
MLLIRRDKGGDRLVIGAKAAVRFLRRLSAFGQADRPVSGHSVFALQLLLCSSDKRSGALVRRLGRLRMGARTCGAMVEYVFEPPDPWPDYWSFSKIELARSCRWLPRAGRGRAMACCGRRRSMRAVEGVINERTAWRCGGGCARKTIQILVRLSLPGAIDYSVRWLGYGCQPSTLSRQHPPLSAVLVIRGR